MFESRFAIACSALAIALLAAAPVKAADDTETKAQVCSACHGQNRVPTDPNTTPIIWGQQGNYLYKELHDYKSGDRANPIMAPIAQGLTLPELRDLANYVAAKTWPESQAAANLAATPPEGIVMCKACHGQNFEGGAPAPRLAGLSYKYLAVQMQNFADGQRTNNGDMPGFMRALTDGQRDAIAHYLAGL